MVLFPRFACVALFTLALWGGAAGQTPAPPPAIGAPASTPPARAPEPEVLALQADLERIIRSPGWPEARYGVMVVSLDRGDTLFALNPDLPLAPASNMKLYSTAAALYYLGPDFRYSTYLLADGEVRDGVLEGDLLLFGTGDPAMSGRLLDDSKAALRALADSLAAQGVREVRGSVIGDGSYFDDAWIGEGWNPDDRLAWYAAPVGALSFAENMVSVRVLPGTAPGEPARIRTAPETSGLAVINQVRTVARGATRVRFEHGPGGLLLSGQIARGHPGVARSIPVVDPANYAAAAMQAVLEARGIRVHGGVRSVRQPESSRVALASAAVPAAPRAAPHVVAVHLSPTLRELAEVTNHVSHNLYAEALLKTVGRVALGEGTFEAGARAVRYMLECETQVDSTHLRVIDGSGLSSLNRVTARATIELLDYMTRSDQWEPFYASLPEAGRPRGLRRMQGTAAEGRLRAKTGTIDRVSSLSGYVRAANGERLAFSILANDVPSTWRAKRVEDAIGARIARFERPPASTPPEPSQ